MDVAQTDDSSTLVLGTPSHSSDDTRDHRGTGPAGLAGLVLNQFKVVLNDRDETIVAYTQARLRAYLSSLQQSTQWKYYQVPGSNPFANIPWNGACPYTPCMVAIGAPKLTGTLYPRDNDLFSGMTIAEIAEQNGCRVDEQAGTLNVVADFAKGDQLPLFGKFSTSRRSPTSSDKGIVIVELRGLVAKKSTQAPTPLYLKPSATCPFKYLRKPTAGEMSNCRVVENTCDRFWPNKVCLELTTPIEASPTNPVELLCNYDLCTKAFAPAKYNATPGQPRKRKRKEVGDADDDREENRSGDSSSSDSDVEQITGATGKPRRPKRVQENPEDELDDQASQASGAAEDAASDPEEGAASDAADDAASDAEGDTGATEGGGTGVDTDIAPKS